MAGGSGDGEGAAARAAARGRWGWGRGGMRKTTGLSARKMTGLGWRSPIQRDALTRSH